MSDSWDTDSGIYTNPYNFGRPVSDPAKFAGRDDELEEIQYYLAQSKAGNYFHIALTGDRTAGKTSLLNVLKSETSEDQFLPVKLTLNSEVVRSQVSFFKEVLETIIAEGSDQGKIRESYYDKFRDLVDNLNADVELQLGFGSVYVGAKENGTSSATDVPQRVLVDDLTELFNQTEDDIESIILMIDEADLLAENQAILQKIRNVFSEIEGYNLVITGTGEMFEQLSQVFSPMSRSFKRINVGDFPSQEETEECIKAPLSEVEQEDLDDQFIGEIHKITGGSPYEISLIAHYMYKRYQEESSELELSPEVLDDVAEELDRVRESGHHEIADQIKHLLPNQIKTVISSIEFPDVPKDWLAEFTLLNDLETLEPDNLASSRTSRQLTIDQLVEKGILEQNEDGDVSFAGGQFDKTYLKYYATSEEIIEDISDFSMVYSNVPLQNLQRKLVEDVILSGDFEEYRIHTMFDRDVEIGFEDKEGQLFTVSANLDVPDGESRVMLEFSPEEREKFYKNLDNSVRFRCNVGWMNQGFVSQIRFLGDEEEQTNNLEDRLESLMDRLTYLDYEISLDEEIDLYRRAIDATEEQNFREAIKRYEDSLEINPKFERAWANKGLMHQHLGETEEALECYDEALQLRDSWAQVLKQKGILLIDKGRASEAVEILGKATEENAGLWDAWHNRGRALQRLERFEEAVDCFERAEALAPDNPLPKYARGLCLNQLDDLEKAEEIFSTLLSDGDRSHPNFPPLVELKHSYAIVLSKLARFDEALEYYSEIVEEAPGRQNVWYNKANCELELEKTEAAQESLENAGIDLLDSTDDEDAVNLEMDDLIELDESNSQSEEE